MTRPTYARELKGVVVLEDGTRVYKNYVRYTPLTPEQRKYKVRKPDDPGAVRFRGDWFLPLPLLDEEAREMPATRPDTDAYEHTAKPRKCQCVPCQRPEAVRWQEKWRKDNGIKKKRLTKRQRSYQKRKASES